MTALHTSLSLPTRGPVPDSDPLATAQEFHDEIDHIGTGRVIVGNVVRAARGESQSAVSTSSGPAIAVLAVFFAVLITVNVIGWR